MQAYAGGNSWNMYGVFSKIVPDLPFFAEMPMYRAFPDGRSCLDTSHRPPVDLPYSTCFSLNVFFVFFLTFSVAVFFPFFDGRHKEFFPKPGNIFSLAYQQITHHLYTILLRFSSYEYLLHSLPSLLFPIKCDRLFLNRTYPQTAYSYVCPTGGLREVYGRSQDKTSRPETPCTSAFQRKRGGLG